MKHIHLRVVILVILVWFGIVSLIFFTRKPWQTTLDNANESTIIGTQKMNATETKKNVELKKVYDDPWEEFIDKDTEAVVASFLKNMPEWFTTEEQIDALRKRIRRQAEAMAEQYKKVLDKPPVRDYSKGTFRSGIGGPTKIYEGPQTPEAIMAQWDSWYSNTYPNLERADAQFPRSEWIQELLDMGITFKTHNDYTRLMGIRRYLADVEDKPDVWTSGQRGIPASDSFEEYKKATIQRKLWQGEQMRMAETADPETSGGYFFDDAPDVFLPAKKNRLYVHRDPNAHDVMKMWGQPLTTKQYFDLMYRGKGPEGWEVIYLDENYNEISEKPPHVTREMVRSWELPPKDWMPPEGVTLPEGFEEDLRSRGWKGTWTQQPDTIEGPLPPDRATLAREAAEAKRAVEAEWKDFEKALRDFERLANMSDAELETEFQKRFMSSLPGIFTDESIEKTIREQFSPTRFENAEKLLQEYGPEEGFRRLAEKDAELAKQLENIFGKRSAPSQKSGRFVPRDGRQPPPNTQPPPEDDQK